MKDALMHKGAFRNLEKVAENEDLARKIKWLKKHEEAVNKYQLGLCDQVLVRILEDINNGEIDNWSPEDKVNNAKKIAEVRKSLAGKADVAVQLNINQISSEEAKRYAENLDI